MTAAPNPHQATIKTDTLAPELLTKIDAYWRAANYLFVAQIDRLPQTGGKGRDLKEQLQAKLIEHKQYIDKHGQDLPEIRNWKWGNAK